MAEIKWEDPLQLNVASIDEQHQKLVSLYNILVGLVEAYEEEILLMRALENLSAYVVTHFEYEEQLMERAGYKKLQEHKREHEDLLRAAETVVRNGRINVRETLTPTIMAFLGRWITSHILGADRDYASLLQKKNIY